MEISEAIEHAREVAMKYNKGSMCRKEHNQLADWLEELVRLRAELARVTAELDAARELLAEYSGVDSCKTIKTCFGYPLDEVQRLVEADKEGRCVVFPCKPSDVTVYQLRGKKHALGRGVHPRHISCAVVWSDGKYKLQHQGMEPCRDVDFGKTWFLSEEEARAASTGKGGDLDESAQETAGERLP